MPFHPLIDQGYFVTSVPEHEGEFRHVFYGAQQVPVADCPNCEKPLIRYFQLDTTDPRLGCTDAPTEFLPLLYCWSCKIPTFPFSYRILPACGVEFLMYAVGKAKAIYENYPEAFPPSGVKLIALTERQQALIHRGNKEEYDDWVTPDLYGELDEIFANDYQIGGEPQLTQTPWERAWRATLCPLCLDEMPFLASFYDANLDPRGFSGEDTVQVVFTYCPKCHVVSAQHQCD